MNVELKQIAESKVRQLGGTVCGVLVRNEAGALATVSEHGRVTWLDDFEGQAARANQAGSGEAVAWSWVSRGRHVTVDKSFAEELRADGELVVPLHTRPSASVPEGWKLVPISFDDNMINAALMEEAKANQRGEPAAFTDLWEAILEVAPNPPAEQEVE